MTPVRKSIGYRPRVRQDSRNRVRQRDMDAHWEREQGKLDFDPATYDGEGWVGDPTIKSVLSTILRLLPTSPFLSNFRITDISGATAID